MFTHCFVISGLCTALSFALTQAFSEPAHGSQPPKDTKSTVSFINDVAPILKENCFACHDAKKRKGKFEMTTYETLRKGGPKEDPITPGKPDESLLINGLTGTA